MIGSDFSPGDRVYWNDPDGGVCSTAGDVQQVRGEVVSLLTDSGGWVEAFAHELQQEPVTDEERRQNERLYC